MSPTAKLIALAAVLGTAAYLTSRPSYPKGTYPLPRTPLEKLENARFRRKMETIRKSLKK